MSYDRNMKLLFSSHNKKRHEAMALLVDKFFAGETSLQEERMLYVYFSGPDVSDALKQYAPMFADFAAIALPQDEASAPDDIAPRTRMSLFIRQWRAAVAAVAVVLGLGGAAFGVYNYRQSQLLACTFEGSYVIENGTRNTNLRSIMPKLQAALQHADAIERTADASQMIDDAEQRALDCISDAAERQRIEQLMNE